MVDFPSHHIQYTTRSALDLLHIQLEIYSNLTAFLRSEFLYYFHVGIFKKYCFNLLDHIHMRKMDKT